MICVSVSEMVDTPNNAYVSKRFRFQAHQQFRLAASCISNVYYVVEDWQVSEKMQTEGLQIMTAKSQIQMHSGFFLKETHKLSETIDFLATLTKLIEARLSTVKVIPTRHVSRSSYSSLQTHLRKRHPAESFLTSFEAYQDINDKSASRTLRERFGRMLLLVKGMSAERVGAVLDTWDTPRALWEDLKSHAVSFASEAVMVGEGTKSKRRDVEMLFADRVTGEGRRKIGDALSREVSHNAHRTQPLISSCIGRS